MSTVKLDSILAVIVSVALGATTGCTHTQRSQSPTTAPTPNYQAVHTSLAGTLLRIDSADTGVAIQAIDIPSGSSRTVLGPATVLQGGYSSFFVKAIAGPDDSGLIAFIEAHWTANDKSYALKVIRIDGSGERTIVSRKGDVIWERAVGRSLAISRQGNRVALVGQMHGTQMPDALLDEGPLELWDVTPGAAPAPVLRTMVLDEGLAWLPDGKNIACVRLLPRGRIAANAGTNTITDPAPNGFGSLFTKWDRVPVVCIVNVQTGQERTLCVGIKPIISTDGRMMLVEDVWGAWQGHDQRFRKVDIASGDFQAVPVLPGQSYRKYVALGPTNECLYLQPPAPGESSGKTKFYSPLVGPRQLLLLKAGKVGQAGGEMIGNDFDPRHDVSFSSK